MSQADNDKTVLVPKLPLGNPEGEALASRTELPSGSLGTRKNPPQSPFFNGGRLFPYDVSEQANNSPL